MIQSKDSAIIEPKVIFYAITELVLAFQLASDARIADQVLFFVE